LLALAAAGTLLAAILARGLPEGVELTAVAVAAIATSSWNGVASVAVAETAGQARSGTALGLYNTVVALTSALAVAGLAALASTAGWSAAFLAAALCGFLAAAVMPTARDAQGLRPVLRYD
jgi:MFS family permease